MIREYREQDNKTLAEMLKLPNGHYHDKETVDLEGFQENFVYEDDEGGLKGFVCIEIGEKISQIICYVAPIHRNKGIGTELFEYGKNRLKQLDPNTIWVFFRNDVGTSAQFYQKRGAKPWYAYHMMVLKSDAATDLVTSLRQKEDNFDFEVSLYSEDKFDEYLEARADAFFSVNQLIDSRPYDERERRQAIKNWADRHKHELYMFYKDQKLVGSIALMEGFFDEVFVAPAYQGKGYGKAIVDWAINKGKEMGWKSELCVVTGNLPAINLYKASGFEIVQTLEMNRFFSVNKEPDYRGPIGG